MLTMRPIFGNCWRYASVPAQPDLSRRKKMKLISDRTPPHWAPYPSPAFAWISQSPLLLWIPFFVRPVNASPPRERIRLNNEQGPKRNRAAEQDSAGVSAHHGHRARRHG